MTITPPLNGQLIGQAERATRALLDAHLAETGTPFEVWVSIKLVGDAGPMGARDLADRLVAALRIRAEEAEQVVAAAVDLRLVGGEPLGLTPEGDARFASITAAIAAVTQRLYGDLPVDDLAATRRVLETITARARVELAGR